MNSGERYIVKPVEDTTDINHRRISHHWKTVWRKGGGRGRIKESYLMSSINSTKQPATKATVTLQYRCLLTCLIDLTPSLIFATWEVIRYLQIIIIL